MAEEKTIGQKIKQLRLTQNMVLRDISSLTDLSVGYLSQVERGSASISLTSLEKIANALGVQLSELFERKQLYRECIVREYEHKQARKNNDACFSYSLSNHNAPYLLKPLLCHILPGATDGTPPVEPGREYFIHVLEGILSIDGPEQKQKLYPGDSIHFFAIDGWQLKTAGAQPVRLILIAC